MAIQITITDAGRAEIVNAENTGTAPVLISEVGIGTGQYTPDPTQTALQNEIKRLTTVSGQVVADDTIHVTASDESADAYSVYEFGLYTDSGTLFAVYSQTGSEIVNKAAESAILLAVDVIFSTIDAASLTFGNANFVNPDATRTTKGIATLANDHRLPLIAAGDLSFGRKYHIASNDTFTLESVAALAPGDSLIISKSQFNAPIIELHPDDVTAGVLLVMQDYRGATVTDANSIQHDLNTEIKLVFNSTDIEVIL